MPPFNTQFPQSPKNIKSDDENQKSGLEYDNSVQADPSRVRKYSEEERKELSCWIGDCISMTDKSIGVLLEERVWYYLSESYLIKPEMLRFLPNQEYFFASQKMQDFLKGKIIECLSRGVLSEYYLEYLKNREEFLTSQEIQDLCKKTIIERGDLSWDFPIDGPLSVVSQEFVLSQEVQDIIKKRIIDSLAGKEHSIAVNFESLVDSTSRFLIDKEQFLASNEIQDLLKKRAIYRLSVSGSIDGLLPYFSNKEQFLASQEVQKALKDGLTVSFSEGYFPYFIKRISVPNQERILESQEVQEALKRGIIKSLKDGQGSGGNSSFLVDPEQFLSSQEVQKALKDGILKCFLRHDSAKHLLSEFNISEERFMASQEGQDLLKKCIVKQIDDGAYIDGYLPYLINREDFFASLDVVNCLGRRIFRYTDPMFGRNYPSRIYPISKINSIEDFLTSQEIQDCLKTYIIEKSSSPNIGWLLPFIANKEDFFALEEVQNSLKRNIIDYVRDGGVFDDLLPEVVALLVNKEEFLASEEMQDALIDSEYNSRNQDEDAYFTFSHWRDLQKLATL